MTALRRAWAIDLHHFWFHQLRPADWFGGGAALDLAIQRRFAHWHAMMQSRPASSFLDEPRGAVAAILLFDQVPRNIFRGSAEAFASDYLARALTHAALERGFDQTLNPVERQFLYMPLMHSEDIADQRLSLQLFVHLPRHGWVFARAHYRMIARFGRFPHRNGTLGRRSTPAEEKAVAAGNAW